MNSSMIFPFLLITLLCADTFIFGFSYGLDRVKIAYAEQRQKTKEGT